MEEVDAVALKYEQIMFYFMFFCESVGSVFSDLQHGVRPCRLPPGDLDGVGGDGKEADVAGRARS